MIRQIARQLGTVFRLPPGWSYAIHTTATALLSYYVAFWLQLDTPYSAATTVFILANPMRGMVLSKGLYRALGTLAGVVASFVFIAWFAQTPMLFMICFALWLGLCTGIATLLRYFRAYGAVLAGYTISIVAVGAIDNPNATFDIGMSRLAVVVVGIVVSGLMTIILPPNQGRQRLQGQLKALSANIAGFVGEILERPEDASPDKLRGLIRSIQAIDPLIESAGAESIATAARVSDMRILSRRLYEVLSLLPAVRESLIETRDESCPADPPHAALRQFVADFRVWVAGYATASEAQFRRGAETLRDRRARLVRDFSAATHGVFAELMLLDRLDDLLARLPGVLLEAMARSSDRPGSALKPQIRFHTDPYMALINGTRAALAVFVAYAIWYWTGWTDGAIMLVAIAPICAMLALLDNAEAGSIGFLQGVIVAVVLGLPWSFILLPQVSGFPLMALVMGVPFLIGTYLMTKPAHGVQALSFLIFFNTFIGLRNPMSYDVVSFLNFGLAILLGSIAAVFVFRLIFPANALARARRVARALRRDVERLAEIRDVRDFATVQHRMYDRMAVLIGIAGIDRATAGSFDVGGHAALRIAFEIGRIRTMLYRYPTLDAAIGRDVEMALTGLHHLSRTPEAALSDAAQGERMMTEKLDTATPELRPLMAAVARSLAGIAALIDTNRGFFDAASSRS